MTTQETERLMGYWRAKVIGRHHQPLFRQGKRLVKGHAKGVGQVLANSTIGHSLKENELQTLSCLHTENKAWPKG